jgi:hypothetical protein
MIITKDFIHKLYMALMFTARVIFLFTIHYHEILQAVLFLYHNMIINMKMSNMLNINIFVDTYTCV